MSEELLQSVSDPVFTIVLDDPGLVIDLQPTPSVLSACQEHYWEVDYYNDSESPDDTVTVALTIDAGIDLT